MKPIPVSLLRHSATLKVALARDEWGANTYTTYSLTRVNMQPTNSTRKSVDNTTVSFVGMLTYDRRNSRPALDFMALKKAADAVGGDMKITFGGIDYTVQLVDTLYDDSGRVHHVELYLV